MQPRFLTRLARSRRLLAMTAGLATMALSGCSASNVQHPTSTPHWVKVRVAHCDHLHVGRGVHATLTTPRHRGSTCALWVRSDQTVQVHERGHNLILSRPLGRHADLPNVRLDVPRLRALTVTGNGEVQAHQLKARQLVLVDQSNQKIDLSGVLNVRRVLINHPDADVSLHWLNGGTVQVQALAGQLNLAGRVHRVVLTAQGRAMVRADQLRSDHVWAKLCDRAMAWVMPMRSLNALATQHSHVVYRHYLNDAAAQRYSREYATVLFSPFKPPHHHR